MELTPPESKVAPGAPTPSAPRRATPAPARPPRPAPSLPARPANFPPAPVQSVPAASPSSALGQGVSPAPLPGGDVEASVRRFLRGTVGCAHEECLRLTPAERERCDAWARRDARKVAGETMDAIPSEKRAYYDTVEQAYQDIRQYQGLTEPAPLGGGAQGMYAERKSVMPGRSPGIGCSIPFGVPKGWKGPDKPPNSLKLGPLPCFVTPPQGVLTEESSVKPP